MAFMAIPGFIGGIATLHSIPTFQSTTEPMGGLQKSSDPGAATRGVGVPLKIALVEFHMDRRLFTGSSTYISTSPLGPNTAVPAVTFSMVRIRLPVAASYI